MHLQWAPSYFARQAREEEPDLVPILEERTPGEPALDDVVPSSGLVLS